VTRKLPYGSHQANALAVNLNGGDVNAASSYYGTSPSAAVARNRDLAHATSEGRLPVTPSEHDRIGIQNLGQKSSAIINSAGTYSVRFGWTNALDGPIRPLGGR
jgi:hypothetical protein